MPELRHLRYLPRGTYLPDLRGTNLLDVQHAMQPGDLLDMRRPVYVLLHLRPDVQHLPDLRRTIPMLHVRPSADL